MITGNSLVPPEFCREPDTTVSWSRRKHGGFLEQYGFSYGQNGTQVHLL